MRHRSSTTIPLAIIAALIGGGCEPESPPPSPGAIGAPPDVEWTPGSPRLTFDRTSHDFGRMKDIEERTTRLTFHNTGGRDLVIDTIKFTLGCRSNRGNLDRFPPGRGGYLDVHLTPLRTSNAVERTLTVISNAAGGPETLRFTADVRKYLVADPRKLELQTLPLGREHRAGFTITSPDMGLKIGRIKSSSRFVSCRRLEAASSTTRGADPLRTEAFEVVISPDAPWGRLDEEVSVRIAAGHPVAGRYEYGDGYFRKLRSKSSSGSDVVVRVPVRGRVFGAITAEPAVIRVDATADITTEHRVRLSHSAGSAMTATILHAWAEVVLGGSNERAQVRARVQPVAADGCDLVLTLSGRRPGRVRGAIVVETDVAGEERLVIPITGAVRGAGAR